MACALAALTAGFVGARYAAAIAGPAALAPLFALTTTAGDEAGVWAALVITIAAAALGAAARQRRR